MYHYFYKITNNINNHFYYGVHSTNNLNDGYMGSGKRLHYAYKKYGIENFTKEILKFFNTKDEAFLYESEVVTEELVIDDNCYNLILGGKGFNCTGFATVKDSSGNIFFAPVDDPRIKSGELVGVSHGYGNYIDKDGNSYHLPTDHYLVKNGVVFGFNKNKTVVKDSSGNKFLLDVNDERLKNGELQHVYKNMITAKDKNNNFYYVSIDDKRYVSGELSPIWKDRKHTEKTKDKMHKTHLNNEHQKGEKNSQYGTTWMTNGNKNIKIKKEYIEEYKNNGWVIGRRIDKISYKSEDKIDLDKLIEYRNSGLSWIDITKKFNVGKNALLRYRRRHNIE